MLGQQVVVDAGLIRIRTDSISGTTGVSLAPAVRYVHNGVTLAGTGTYAGFGTRGWSGEGVLTGSYIFPLGGRIRAEVSGLASATTSAFGPATQALRAGARIYRQSNTGGSWIGTDVERSTTGLSSGALGVYSVTVGGWRQLGPALVVLSMTPTSATDGSRFVDGLASARVAFRPFAVQLGAALRTWMAPRLSGTEAAIAGNVTVPLESGLALVAGGGAYLADVAQGLPSGRFLTLALRIGSGLAPAPRPPRAGLTGAPLPRAPATVSIGVTPEGLRQITVRAPDATSVEVKGDFTDWEAVPLLADGHGNWNGKFPLAVGVHRLNVRVDGGIWGAPSGLPAERDEFGVTSGVLVVE